GICLEAPILQGRSKAKVVGHVPFIPFQGSTGAPQKSPQQSERTSSRRCPGTQGRGAGCGIVRGQGRRRGGGWVLAQGAVNAEIRIQTMSNRVISPATSPDGSL